MSNGSYMNMHGLAAAIVAAVTGHIPGVLRSHTDVLVLALSGVVLMISSLAVRRAVEIFSSLSVKYRSDPRARHSSEAELIAPVGRSL